MRKQAKHKIDEFKFIFYTFWKMFVFSNSFMNLVAKDSIKTILWEFTGYIQIPFLY